MGVHTHTNYVSIQTCRFIFLSTGKTVLSEEHFLSAKN